MFRIRALFNILCLLGLAACALGVATGSRAANTGSVTLSATVQSVVSIDSTGCSAEAAYTKEVVADTPVGFWRLGEYSGTTAAAVVGPTGTYANGPMLGQEGALLGSPNAAANFDGVDDYVSVGDNHDFAGTASFTLEAWVRPNSLVAFPRIFSKDYNDVNGKQGYYIRVSASDIGILRFRDGLSDGALSTSALALDKYSHVAGTYDGSVLRLYVNGVQVASDLTASTSILDSTFALTLGRRSGVNSDYFDGAIDEPAVYSTALPPARILAHYDAGRKAIDRTDFGMLTPPFAKVTGQSAGQDCSIGFGSSNNTAMLKVYQADGGGNAMLPGPSSGIVGHWPMNGSEADIGPLGVPLVRDPTSVPTWDAVDAPAGMGQSLRFAGNGKATAPYRTAWDLDTLTVDAWVKVNSLLPNASNQNFVFYKSEGVTNRNFAIYVDSSNGKAISSFSTDATTNHLLTTSGSIANGSWHHLALVIDSSSATRTATFYLDGVPAQAPLTFTGNVDNPTRGLDLGADHMTPMGRFLDGWIDEARIHNVARSADDIRSYYLGTVDQYSNTGAAGDKDWSSTAATTNMFGACLSSALNATPTWTASAGCPITDPGVADTSGAWKPIPATAGTVGSKIASTATNVTTGTANLRFGMRGTSTLPPGSYTAPMVFEAIAPNI